MLRKTGAEDPSHQEGSETTTYLHFPWSRRPLNPSLGLSQLSSRERSYLRYLGQQMASESVLERQRGFRLLRLLMSPSRIPNRSMRISRLSILSGKTSMYGTTSKKKRRRCSSLSTPIHRTPGSRNSLRHPNQLKRTNQCHHSGT